MKLMMIVLLYAVCVILIRSALIKVLVGNAPSARMAKIITLIALLWPIWPELVVYAALGLFMKKFIAFFDDA